MFLITSCVQPLYLNSRSWLLRAPVVFSGVGSGQIQFHAATPFVTAVGLRGRTPSQTGRNDGTGSHCYLFTL